MNILSSGIVVGALSAASALSIAFKYPALGLFFSDPATATEVTAIVTAGAGFVAGLLKGLKG